MSENTSIDSLPPADYSNNPREHVSYVGQVAGVRRFDPTDGPDMQRLKQILHSKEVAEYMTDADMPDSDIVEWANDDWQLKGGSKDVLFAITAATGSVDKGLTEKDEIGEVEGFVWFYHSGEGRQNFKEVVSKGIVEEPSRATPFYEISYAKRPDAPPKHIASGVRQACLELFKAGRRKNESDKVLQPQMNIIAYIEPENKSSALVAQASGFEKKGSINLPDDEGKPELNDVYMVNWEKLNEFMHASTDEAFWKDKLQKQ